MDTLHAVYLALIQGITEFLPISSSAHLILLPRLFGWQDQGLAFDVAVHVGTLSAVVSYFRVEVGRMARDWTRSLLQRRLVGESRLAWAVLLGTIPVGLAGFVLNDLVAHGLRSPMVVAWATIGFGLLLWWADARGRGLRTEARLRWTDVLVVGVAQALALIPGTSRSGVTITAGLAMGLSRQAAARFSFLLSIPVIVLAGGYQAVGLFEQQQAVDWGSFVVGVLVAGVSAYVCIHFFLRALQRIGMWPFVVYRLILGAVLLVLWS